MDLCWASRGLIMMNTSWASRGLIMMDSCWASVHLFEDKLVALPQVLTAMCISEDEISTSLTEMCLMAVPSPVTMNSTLIND